MKSKNPHNERLRLAPWISRLDTPSACQGTTRQDREDFACRARAYWQFDALPESTVRSGAYCWSHLLSAAQFGDPEESLRFEDWERGRART